MSSTWIGFSWLNSSPPLPLLLVFITSGTANEGGEVGNVWAKQQDWKRGKERAIGGAYQLNLEWSWYRWKLGPFGRLELREQGWRSLGIPSTKNLTGQNVVCATVTVPGASIFLWAEVMYSDIVLNSVYYAQKPTLKILFFINPFFIFLNSPRLRAIKLCVFEENVLFSVLKLKLKTTFGPCFVLIPSSALKS